MHCKKKFSGSVGDRIFIKLFHRIFLFLTQRAVVGNNESTFASVIGIAQVPPISAVGVFVIVAA